MPIQFSAPPLTLLLLALVFAGLVFWSWWMHRHSITDMGTQRKRLALGLRIIVLALVILALAGLKFVRKSDSLSVIFLMDASKSIRDDQKEQEIRFVQDAARSMRKNDTAGVVTYGKDPDQKVIPEVNKPFKLDSLHHSGATNATNIAQAIDAALAMPTPVGSAVKFVLLSDGNENVGSALASLPSLTAKHVTVDSVVLPSSLKKEALIDKMVLPSRVKIGEPFQVKVITSALNAQRGRLTLRRDGQPVGTARDVDMPAGKRVHTFDVHIDKPGFYRFESQLETDAANDTILENNKGLGFVSVRGKPQVLYIADSAERVPFLQQALKGQNIDVAYLPPAATPTSPAAFQMFDSVILSDVPRLVFSQAQMQAIQVSTRDFGVGFGMIGGVNSFGAGRYRDTPIEETLPVTLEVKKQKRLPSVAVVLVIEDLEIPSSVNMSKEAAKALVELLDPMDEIGVLDCNGFGGFSRGGGVPGGAGGTWRVPLQHVTDRASIQSTIDTLENMGDPPSYDPYLLEAATKLQASEAKIKHIIFLGDGDAAYEGMGGTINSAMAKVRNMGITVSSVATAADQQGIAYMAQIARDGGGHSYVADQPGDLPRILLKDQQTISAPPIIEEPFTPRQMPGDEVITGIGGMPPLLGYNIATPKSTASVSLTSHRNDPVLATWRYGLGRSMAFMSDDKNRWAIQWLPWSGYGQFWAQAIRWTMRSFTPSDFQTQVNMEGTRGHVTVTAIDKDGKFVNRLNFKARVASPEMDSSKPLELDVRQTGPGTYEAWFDAGQIGTYLVNVVREVPGKAAEMTVSGLVVPYSPEYRDLQANDYLMTQLAQAGGGAVAANPAEAFGGNRPVLYKPTDLTQWLLALALLLFPVDVGVRRLALEKSDFQRALEWLRAKLGRRAPRPVREAATPELGRLMNAKQAGRASYETRATEETLETGETLETTAVMPSTETTQRPAAAAAQRPTATTAQRPNDPTTQRPRTQTLRPDNLPSGVSDSAAQPPSTLNPQPSTPPEEEGGMSRLMAAKRRAKEQQEKDEEQN